MGIYIPIKEQVVRCERIVLCLKLFEVQYPKDFNWIIYAVIAHVLTLNI